jgi:hypothetical protein
MFDSLENCSSYVTENITTLHVRLFIEMFLVYVTKNVLASLGYANFKPWLWQICPPPPPHLKKLSANESSSSGHRLCCSGYAFDSL